MTEDTKRLRLLAEAGQVLSESLDYKKTFQAFARLALEIADYCIVFELESPGVLRQIAAAHVDPRKEPLLERLGMLYQASTENPASLVGRVARTGEAVLVVESSLALAEAMTGEQELLEIYQAMQPKSVMVLPLVARGQIFGTCSLITSVDSGRAYGEEDLPLARELAHRAALAIDNARLFGEAQSANRAKDHFLAVLSHELRTPLTPALMTAGQLLEAPELPDALRPQVERIHRNIELESKLLDDLLDLTRISRGKLDLHHEVTDVHALVQHAVDVFCASQIQLKRLECTTELAAAEHHVWGDPVRLQQVFWNLLQNAVKFTPEDGKISARSWNGQPGSISVSIVDQGIGIDSATLPSIFKAFEQMTSGGARRFGGLGLGLSVCKALVELHEGTLEAVSAGSGKGSTFTVTLATTARPAKEAAEERDLEVSGRPLSILLVEDHEDTRQVMVDLLERARHRVVAAHDVRSARAAAAHDRFDLVVSDLGLPDGSGHDLMRYLRENYGLKGIAVSGYGAADDIERSLSAGFVEHLTKPVYPQKLKEAIARAGRWPGGR